MVVRAHQVLQIVRDGSEDSLHAARDGPDRATRTTGERHLRGVAELQVALGRRIVRHDFASCPRPTPLKRLMGYIRYHRQLPRTKRVSIGAALDPRTRATTPARNSPIARARASKAAFISVPAASAVGRAAGAAAAGSSRPAPHAPTRRAGALARAPCATALPHAPQTAQSRLPQRAVRTDDPEPGHRLASPRPQKAPHAHAHVAGQRSGHLPAALARPDVEAAIRFAGHDPQEPQLAPRRVTVPPRATAERHHRSDEMTAVGPAHEAPHGKR